MITVPVPLSLAAWEAASLAHHRYNLSPALPQQYIGEDAPQGLVPGYDGGLALLLLDTLAMLRKPQETKP